MPTLHSLHFDTTNWQPIAGDGSCLAWRNEHNDDLVLLLEFGPPGMPAVGDPTAAIRQSLARHAGEALHLLAADRRRVAGLNAVVSLIRARQGTGWRYGAAVMLPFSRFTYSLILVADEHGVTGLRETAAALWGHIQGQGHRPLTADEDQLLDAALPFHPQARVRTYLDELLVSLKLAPELASEVDWPPSRLPTATGSLELADGCLLRRVTGGRLVGRFPLACTGPPRVVRQWSLTLIAVSLMAIAGGVLAYLALDGWWANGVAGVSGIVALLCCSGWRAQRIVLDTPAGPLQWSTFALAPVVGAFREHAASLVAPPEEAPCPPSS